MLSGMPQATWQAQVAYYRRRAAEYDLTSYGDVPRADQRIASLIGQLRPEGDVLEIACGTGIWTRHLAARARRLTALDAAPEMIVLARQRVADARVTFLAADVLDWVPPRRFDTVFFAFWLSHVPASAFGRFWSVVRAALAGDGPRDVRAAVASGRRGCRGNGTGVVDRGEGRAQGRGRDRVPRLQRRTQGQVQALAGFAVGHIGHPKATLRSACAAVGGKLRG